MFNEFPYTNFHELNLDWIIKKVKEAYGPDNPPEGIVLSVNGEDGNVVLYQDAIVRFPDVTDGTWNIHRIAGGASSGIQFLPNKAQRISGAQRLDMYDAGNPPPYPVNSVNGQTGDVTIQIPVQSVNGQTGVVVIPPDFQSNGEIMEFTQASDGNYWGLSRVVSTGTASIYLDTSNNTVKAYITYESTDGQTVVTLPLLTSADIPSSSGVLSINGKTGAVTLYGTDIYTDANSQQTIAQNLAANGTAIASLQQTQSEDHTSLIQTRSLLNTAQTNISNLQPRMTTAEGNISSNAQNLTGEIGRAKSVEQDLMEGMAILINGDQSATGAAAGQYVYLKDSTITGAADGLYKAAQAIPANTVIDVTYLTAVSAGGLNSLNDRMPTLLWTNSSPTTPRGEGNIATGIDFNGFTVFAVKVNAHVSVDRYVSCIVPLASETEMIFATDNTTANRNVYYRYITINNGNIYITGATGGDGTTYQDRLIPVEVYGIW